MKNGLIAFSLFFVAACGRPDMTKSIEAMNEGVDSFNQGALSKAEEKFQESVSLSKDNHRAWYNLGQTREHRKKWEEAVEAYENAVKIDGADPMYHYRLGKAYYEVESFDDAQSHLEKAVEQNPKLFKAHFYLGKVYESQGDPKKAAEAWSNSAQANPTFGKPFNSLGILYITWDKLPQAVQVLENGVMNVIDPEEKSDVYYHLGLAYEKQNKLDKAIEAYTNALELRGGNIDALRQRGISYAGKGEVKKAKADLEKFVQAGGGNDAFQLQAANEILMQLAMKGQ